MIQVHPPIKKSKYFFCKVTKDGNRIMLKIPYAVFTEVVSLSKQEGYLSLIDLAQDHNALEIINTIEQYCKEAILNNNRKWFRNSLDEDTIMEMFDPTLLQTTVRSYISFLRSHLEIPNYSDFPDWNSKCKLPFSCHVTLICDGLFIYPDRFGLRWIVHSIKDFKEDPNEIVPEYGEIISYWEEKVEQRKKMLDALMAEIKTSFSDKAVEELKKLL